jgi:hypothetical protein
VGVDLQRPADVPNGCRFHQRDILEIHGINDLEFQFGSFDFIVASSPCEEFSVHGMRHFHPNPKYPETGIKLFNHTRSLCEARGLPYVMENVRPVQKFIGTAETTCGPFALWGSGVPPLMPQGISKGFGKWDREYILTTGSSKSKRRAELKAKWATIPPELANCVADYAERLLEIRRESSSAVLAQSSQSPQ